MSPFAVFCRIREWLRRSEIDHEFEEEIDTHLELARTEYVRRGVAPEEARRLAALKFGKITAVKEAVWEERRLPGPGSFLQDAGYALRDMRKNPGFTLAIVLTLSFGIGLCSVVFSILNGMVLRPLPGVPDPDRLTAIETPVSYPQFENFQKKTGLATAMAAFIGPVPFHVTKGSAAPGRVAGHVVSADYFSTIGVKPLLGRFFEQSDERAAVVVSERFWRTRLQANPKAVGSTLSVNGKDALIIGVGQKEFLGVFPASPADLFVPVSADAVMVPELNNNALHRATDPEFRVLLRLAPRMTLRATEAALDTLTWQMDKQAGKPNEHRYRHIRLMSAGRAIAMPPAGRTSIEFFYGFWVLLLLTLTCANLAGLILARGSTRAREIAIRLSLGARRTRLIQQLLTESLLLAIVAGSAGLGGTYIYFLASAKIGPAKGSNFQIQLQPDWRVLLFTSTISVAAAIGFGLMPALAITRLNLASVLKSGVQFRLGRYRRFGLRNLFVVYQVATAMALVLLVSFMATGLQKLVRLDPGFDAGSLYMFSVDPARDGYSPERSAALLRDLPARLMRLRGVEGAALVKQSPLDVIPPRALISMPPLQRKGHAAVHSVAVQSVGPSFFATTGVPILRGEAFQETHRTVVPAVLNEAAARELFGGANPLGRLLRQNSAGGQPLEVVGVARYNKAEPFASRATSTVFLPFTENEWRGDSSQTVTVLVRSHKPLETVDVQGVLEELGGNLTLFQLQSMRQTVVEANRVSQAATASISSIGLFALLLACVGLAGVTAQTAEQRRKEIGIRLALGARRRQLLRLVMGEGAIMATIGSAAGLAAAFGVLRLLAALFAPMARIIEWTLASPTLMLSVAALLIVLAVAACYLPARRSAAIDPSLALREE